MSGKITGGNGTTYVTGNKTDHQIERFKKWYEKDPARAVDEITGDVDYKSFSNQAALLKHVVRAFKLGMTCIQFLGMLHESIANKWISIIDKWVENNPTQARDISFVETHTEQPHNYTPAMIRLKNISFDGWQAADNLKGFCPYEPLVRLEQILNFPIDQFEHITLEHIDFVGPPDLSSDAIALRTPDDFYAVVLALEPQLKAWETYYDELCKKLKDICLVVGCP